MAYHASRNFANHARGVSIFEAFQKFPSGRLVRSRHQLEQGLRAAMVYHTFLNLSHARRRPLSRLRGFLFCCFLVFALAAFLFFLLSFGESRRLPRLINFVLRLLCFGCCCDLLLDVSRPRRFAASLLFFQIEGVRNFIDTRLRQILTFFARLRQLGTLIVCDCYAARFFCFLISSI